jgi:hypothetical protein
MEALMLRRTTLTVCVLASFVLAGASSAQARSPWQRPTLRRPITVVANASHRSLVLDLHRDYVVKLTRGAERIPGGLSIWGGRNVVIDGGHIVVPDKAGGMVLKNQTGTIWIRGVYISGRRLMEGIDLDERAPRATVVLRDILVATVHGSYATNHADLLQTWAGPSRLLIDGFTGTTNYQGFFLLPNQFLSGQRPRLFDLRHVNIFSRGGYALWRDPGMPFPLHLRDVYVRANPAKPSRDWWLWPKPSTGDRSWAGVAGGSPPRGSYVRATHTGAASAYGYRRPPSRVRAGG